MLRPSSTVPPDSSAAYPYQGLDLAGLSIARAGDAAPLAEASFAYGDPLALPGGRPSAMTSSSA